MSKDKQEKESIGINPFVKEAAINVTEVVVGTKLNLSKSTQIGIAIGTAAYNHPEAVAEIHNFIMGPSIRADANNYKEYGNDPNLNFDTIAPLAGHYDKTNIVEIGRASCRERVSSPV